MGAAVGWEGIPERLLRTLFEWVPVIGTSWLQDPANGGLLQDQGAHNFDFLRWIAGSEPARIFGRVTQSAKFGMPPGCSGAARAR